LERGKREEKEKKQWQRDLNYLGTDARAFAIWAGRILGALNHPGFDTIWRKFMSLHRAGG